MMQRIAAAIASAKGQMKPADMRTLMFTPCVKLVGRVTAWVPSIGTANWKVEFTSQIMMISTMTNSRMEYRGFLYEKLSSRLEYGFVGFIE